MAYLLLERGVGYGLAGRLARAADCLDDAAHVALVTGDAELRSAALANRCWIATWSGDLPEAVRLGEQAVAAAGTGNAGLAWVVLAQAHVYADEAGGHVERAIAACGGPELHA